MVNNKKIVITFNSLPSVDDYLNVFIQPKSLVTPYLLREVFRSERIYGNQAKISSINTTEQAEFHANALSLDYTSDLIIQQTDNVVTIEIDNLSLIYDSFLDFETSGEFATIEFANIPEEEEEDFILNRQPFFYISKCNSLRFANRISFGDASNYKNDENTLSCEANVLVPYKQYILLQTADIITTQFKSSFNNISVKVLKSDNTEVGVTLIKKTTNMGLKDKRDAKKYNLGNGKTGIYFISGNLYDYDSGVDAGDYELNGYLPSFAKVGNWIKLDTTWYLIEDIIFDESKNSEVIQITNTYTGSEVDVIVASIYNKLPYEVYEFTIDFVDYINEIVAVRINNADSEFPEIIQLSEDIDVKVRHENTLDISYWNNTNTDIIYSTGIKHRLRVPFTKVVGIDEPDSENYKTDTNTILISASNYEVEEFKFEPMTKEMWRKLKLALLHENVSIDDVGYVINGKIDSEQLEDTNLYVLKAQMIKTGSVYESQTSGNIGFDSSDIEVPRLVESESGYLEY